MAVGTCFAGLFERADSTAIAQDGAQAVAGAWADYDGDGDLDLFVAQTLNSPNALYRNDGGGSFSRVADLPPVLWGGNSNGAGWGDIDSDGRVDLFVNDFHKGTAVFRNLGGGRFAAAEELTPVGGTDYGAFGGGWADYDGDGRLDLYVSHGGGSVYARGQLYHQAASGRLEGVAIGVVTERSVPSMAAAWGDFNGDGRPDLFVANGVGTQDWFFQNEGSGAFRSVPLDVLTAENGESSGVTWGDYDNDGWLDLFVTYGGNQRSRLYRNLGNGQFSSEDAAEPASEPSLAVGGMWGDYDNDGKLDLYVARRGQEGALYRNLGGGKLGRVFSEPALAAVAPANGCAWGDYDGDGFLDLFVANWGGRACDLFHNQGNGNGWLKVRCVGSTSNHSGIGAKVRVRASIGGETVWQLREITSGDGLGGPELVAHFGLGDAQEVELVRVEWPAGGTSELTRVATRQTLLIQETPKLEIVTQPKGQTVEVGQSAVFEVAARGREPLQYQWHVDGRRIDGAVGNVLRLASVTTADAGSYHVLISDASSELSSDQAVLTVRIPPPLPLLERVLAGPSVSAGGQAVAGAWADYDGDGDLDLFVAQVRGQPNLLYRNEGNGAFVRVIEISPAIWGGGSNGAGWGDIDNDGLVDLFVNDFERGTAVFRNLGDGKFATANVLAAAGGVKRGAFGGGWADYDLDGRLDLYVSYGGGAISARGQLFHQRLDGGFESMPNSVVMARSVPSMAASWGDFNGDLKPDLFVANGVGTQDWFFVNAGSGVFESVVLDVLRQEHGESSGVTWGDFDNDRRLDLFVTYGGQEKSRLYRNLGNGQFASLDGAEPAAEAALAVGGMWGDYDNDGWLDLFVARRNQPGALYRNQGGGGFVRQTTETALAPAKASNGCAWGDYDGDGFLDLFVANWDGQASDLYHNRGNGNGWLKVRCVGSTANRSGIGARVSIRATLRGETVWQTREITSGDGLGGPELVAHFGLGDAQEAEVVRVEWPGGGVREFNSVAARQTWEVTEQPRPPEPPTVVRGPQSQTVVAGASVEFSVVATGSQPLRFLWFFEDQAVMGGTNAVLQLPSVRSEQAGRYRVRVSNETGEVLSDFATLTVTDPNPPEPPRITLNPQSQVVSVGGQVVLEAAASGTPPMTYSWTFQGVRVEGSDRPLWVIDSATLDHSGVYQLIAENPAGRAISEPAVVDIRSNGTSTQGGTVLFVNRIEGMLFAPIYDRDGTTLLEGPAFFAQLYAGVSAESLAAIGPAVPFRSGAGAGYWDPAPDPVRTIPSVEPGGDAWVQVRVWESGFGPSFESAFQAGGKTGKSELLKVRVGGAGLPPSMPADLRGLKSFQISGLEPPVIVQEPRATVVGVGESIDLEVGATGPMLRYQWYHGDDAIPGATSSKYHIAAASVTDAGNYRVRVANAVSEVSSATVTVGVAVNRTVEFAEAPSVMEGAEGAIRLQIKGDPRVTGGTLVVRYDAERLANLGVRWSEAVEGGFAQANLSERDVARLVFALPAPAATGDTLAIADLAFRARSVGERVSTPLVVEVVDLSDASGNAIRGGTLATAGAVEVVPNPLRGDNNANQRLDVGDASILLRWLSHLDEPQPWDIADNDLNGSGTLDSGDAVRVLRSVVDSGPGTTGGAAASSAARQSLVRSAAGLGLLVQPTMVPSHGNPGTVMRLRVEVAGATHGVRGVAFSIRYPTNAIRLVGSESLQVGSWFRTSALAAWNVVPNDSFADQQGQVRFAASGADSTVGTGGTVAELDFTAQSIGEESGEFEVVVEAVEVSADGYSFSSASPGSARFTIARPPRPALSALRSLGPGIWAFQVSGEARRAYTIQVSSDLVSWKNAAGVVLSDDGTALYTDVSTTPEDAKFFRAVQVP